MNLSLWKLDPRWTHWPLYLKIQIYGYCLGSDHAKWTDKLNAKNLIRQRYSADQLALAKVIRIFAKVDDLVSSDLDPSHIIKAAHGSGWNIDITPQTSLALVRQKLCQWTGPYNPHKERQYSHLQPMFFTEEKIRDAILGPTGSAIAYMVYCIHGTAHLIAVSQHRHEHNIYNLEWKLLAPPEIMFDISPPTSAQLQQMIAIAQELCADNMWEFARVDFFMSTDRLYFSEITFTPDAGTKVLPDTIEYQLGLLWK